MWHRAGHLTSKIAFVSERAGGAQIYMMNADGSGKKRHVSGASTPTPFGLRMAIASPSLVEMQVDSTSLSSTQTGRG